MTADEELVYLSAARAIELFKHRALSPREMMAAVIARAEAVEPRINAMAARYFDEALAKAAKAEARYMKPGGRTRSLEGLPLAVKDDTPIKGRRTTEGSLLKKDHIDSYTDPSVERLLRAGAILHARTTCPEFCWPWICSSRLYGVTRNPWNTAITCGSSSGGAAASLAAGSALLATGTDSAGSIRMPAAMCGVVGYKPPYGRNPTGPEASFDAYNHIGPMARSVRDCVMMQNVMAGPHFLDHATVKPKLRLRWPPGPIMGLKLAFSPDLGCHAVAPDVRRNSLAAVERLRQLGAEVEEAELSWAREAIEASHAYGDHIYADRFTDALRDHPELVCDYTPYFAAACRRVTQAEFHRSLTTAGRVWRDHFGPLLQRYDALLCPAVATSEVPADMPPWQEGFTVDGQEVDANGAWVMTILFNMFSRCPVLSLPSGLADNGVPTGLQIAGRPFDDATVFRIAAALEDAEPWYGSAARRPQLSNSAPSGGPDR